MSLKTRLDLRKLLESTVYATLSEEPVSAVTADQLAAAVKASSVPLFAFNPPHKQIDVILRAAWPVLSDDEDVPDEAHDAAYEVGMTYREGGIDAVHACLNAAAPHMPA